MKLIDGLVKDGLTDVYNKVHMGNCAEVCASEMNLAVSNKILLLSNRTTEVQLLGKQESADEVFGSSKEEDALVVAEDEEYKNGKWKNSLYALYSKKQSYCCNRLPLNDGAAAFLMSAEKAAN